MAIKITREEYEKKFGVPVTATPQPTPSTSIGGQIKNAFQGGVGQMKQAITESQAGGNPLSTGAKFGEGAIGAVTSPFAPIGTPIAKGIDYLGNKLSNQYSDKFNESIANIPEEDYQKSVVRPLETIRGLSTIAGTAVGGVKAPKVAGATASKVANAVEPTLNATGRVLKRTGEGAYGLTVVPEESTRLAMQSYQASQKGLVNRVKGLIKGEQPLEKPITEANTAARKGLVGTEWSLGVQAKQVADDLWKSNIQPKLQAVKGQVNMKSFLGEVEKEIKKSGGDITRRRSLNEALNAIKEDYKNVGKIDLEKLQNYKEGWAEFLPDATYKGKPIGAAIKAVHDIMADKARKVIYKYVGEDGKQAYIDYGNLKSIMKSGIKSIGDPAKKSLSKNIWEAVMDKAITPVATFTGKTLYKTGEGLEFIGKKGAKKVKDAVD